MPAPAEQRVAPRGRPGLRGALRRWNRLSRLQKALVYSAIFLSVLASVHFYVNRDVSDGTPPNRDRHEDILVIKSSAVTAERGPATDERQQAADERGPAADERGPAADERDPAADQRQPAADERTPAEGRITFTGPTTARQRAVVDAFRHAWRGYERLAWGHDNLRPVSGTASDWFSLGLTIVDSMDTAYIMGLSEEYEAARRWVRDELVFTRNKDVNLFEVTIRVLGALLTNYHFSGDRMFLSKARDLGSRLLAAFSSPSGVPYSDVNLGTRTAHAPEWSHYSSTAEVATLQLEFRDLARATGDPSFERAAAAVSEHLHTLPKKRGLVPIFISPSSGQFLPHAAVTLGARGDSYYEYLLKQWLQTGRGAPHFLDDYVAAVDGMEALLMRRSSPGDLLFVGELAAGSEAFVAKMDHLACFLPGTLALGHANGLPARHLRLAADLLHTCYLTYARQPTFLAPEITHFHTGGGDEDMYVKSADAHNLLRPEFVESLWYMYQLTGNSTYQDWGWRVFQAFEQHCRVENGYTSVANVRSPTPGSRDMMESFFLSETLKYLYLLFSPDRRLLDLRKFVVNSEAHALPLRDR